MSRDNSNTVPKMSNIIIKAESESDGLSSSSGVGVSLTGKKDGYFVSSIDHPGTNMQTCKFCHL